MKCSYLLFSRPKLAIVRFNAKEDWSGGSEEQYESRIYVLIHELGHAFGFSRFRFGSFIDPNSGERLKDPTM